LSYKEIRKEINGNINYAYSVLDNCVYLMKLGVENNLLKRINLAVNQVLLKYVSNLNEYSTLSIYDVIDRYNHLLSLNAPSLPARFLFAT